MIQRIQTVYLLLGALVLASLGFFDAPWSGPAAREFAWFVPSLIGLLVVTVGTALGAIFLYERRRTQRRVVVGVQVLTFLLTAVFYGGLYLTETLALRDPSGILWGRSVMLLVPILAYAFFWLARRGIQHDIDLVESMDRIR